MTNTYNKCYTNKSKIIKNLRKKKYDFISEFDSAEKKLLVKEEVFQTILMMLILLIISLLISKRHTSFLMFYILDFTSYRVNCCTWDQKLCKNAKFNKTDWSLEIAKVCALELFVTFCTFCATNQTVISSLQPALLLQEFFQYKVKSINLMTEIISLFILTLCTFYPYSKKCKSLSLDKFLILDQDYKYC